MSLLIFQVGTVSLNALQKMFVRWCVYGQIPGARGWRVMKDKRPCFKWRKNPLDHFVFIVQEDQIVGFFHLDLEPVCGRSSTYVGKRT